MKKRIPQQSNWASKFQLASATGNTFLIADISGFSLQKFKASLIDALINQNKDTGLLFRHIHKDLYRMYVIEKDGSESAFCGNGARVFAQYLYETKKIELARLKLKEGLEPIYFGKHEKGAFVQCGVPEFLLSFQFEDNTLQMFQVCGEPHFITHDFFDADHLKLLAKEIRKDISTNVSCIKDNKILTYERGVEDITLSCGSACIAATEYSLMNNLRKPNKMIIDWECLGGINLVDIEGFKFSLIGLSQIER